MKGKMESLTPAAKRRWSQQVRWKGDKGTSLGVRESHSVPMRIKIEAIDTSIKAIWLIETNALENQKKLMGDVKTTK